MNARETVNEVMRMEDPHRTYCLRYFFAGVEGAENGMTLNREEKAHAAWCVEKLQKALEATRTRNPRGIFKPL